MSKKLDEKNLSQDSMIKDLIRDYPEDALEYFNPKIYERYGHPVAIDFHIQENKKHSHFDSKLINDIVVIYTFPNDKKVVLTLIEHWSNKSGFDIHRFAHYLINLDFQFPGYEKLPVALFTDKSEKWFKEPKNVIEIKCLDEIYLRFTYRLIKLKADEAERYKETKNRFIAVLRAAMKWDIDKKVILAFDFIKHYSILEQNIKITRKHIDIIEFYFYLTKYELSDLKILLNKGEKTGMLVQEFIKEGEIKGERKGKLEDAKKMYDKGFSIDDILDITGLKKEDLIEGKII